MPTRLTRVPNRFSFVGVELIMSYTYRQIGPEDVAMLMQLLKVFGEAFGAMEYRAISRGAFEKFGSARLPKCRLSRTVQGRYNERCSVAFLTGVYRA